MAKRPQHLDISGANAPMGPAGNGRLTPRGGRANFLMDLPSPRVGEVPPALSPLDAFALHSRVLARKLEESTKAGRRLSRLPHHEIQTELAKRPGYFRSMSSGSEAYSEVDTADETDDDEDHRHPQSHMKIEANDDRPVSQYPFLGHIADEKDRPLSAVQERSPAPSAPQSRDGPSQGYFGIQVPRSSSPEPFDTQNSKMGGISPALPSLTSSIDSIQSSQPRTLTNESASKPYQGGLAPPRSPMHPRSARSIASIRSVIDSADEDNGSVTGFEGVRQSTKAGNVSNPHTPLNAEFQPLSCSPSAMSDVSAGDSLPRPSFNFSRPRSSAGMKLAYDSRPSLESKSITRKPSNGSSLRDAVSVDQADGAILSKVETLSIRGPSRQNSSNSTTVARTISRQNSAQELHSARTLSRQNSDQAMNYGRTLSRQNSDQALNYGRTMSRQNSTQELHSARNLSRQNSDQAMNYGRSMSRQNSGQEMHSARNLSRQNSEHGVDLIRTMSRQNSVKDATFVRSVSRQNSGQSAVFARSISRQNSDQSTSLAPSISRQDSEQGINVARSIISRQNSSQGPEITGSFSEGEIFSGDESVNGDSRDPRSAGAQSYIYSKYSLPRGRTVERNSAEARKSWMHHQFKWEEPLPEPAPPTPRTPHIDSLLSPRTIAQSIPSLPSTPTGDNFGESISRSRSAEPPGLSSKPRSNHRSVPSSPSITSNSTDHTIRGRQHVRNSPSQDIAGLSPEQHLEKGIEFHNAGSLSKSTYHLRLASRAGLPTAMLLYALACRHGWGMRANQAEGVSWLKRAVDSSSLEFMADKDPLSTAPPGEKQSPMTPEQKTRKAQFALAIYELGMSYMHGWGIPRDRALALRCFEISGSWGDNDALAEAGFCYAQGVGCKKDLHKAAGFYRRAADGGMSMAGQSW